MDPSVLNTLRWLGESTRWQPWFTVRWLGGPMAQPATKLSQPRSRGEQVMTVMVPRHGTTPCMTDMSHVFLYLQ